MRKVTPHQEDITFTNIYTPNIGVPKYINQLLTELKGQIDNTTVIVGHLTFNVHQKIDHQGRKSTRIKQP